MRIAFDKKSRRFSATTRSPFLYRRWSTKDGAQMVDIPRLWAIAEKHVPLPKMKGFGTDWTNDDFLYGIVFDGDVPPALLSEARRAFPDIRLDKTYELPAKFQSVRKGNEKDMGRMYEEIWSKGPLKHELEEDLEPGKCTIKVNYV